MGSTQGKDAAKYYIVMKFEYLHFFREESQDFTESEFLALKGEEGWNLVNVIVVDRDKPVTHEFKTSMLKSKPNREWHYYFKRIVYPQNTSKSNEPVVVPLAQ